MVIPLISLMSEDLSPPKPGTIHKLCGTVEHATPSDLLCGVEKCRMCDRSYLSNEEVSQTTSDGQTDHCRFSFALDECLSIGETKEVAPLQQSSSASLGVPNTKRRFEFKRALTFSANDAKRQPLSLKRNIFGTTRRLASIADRFSKQSDDVEETVKLPPSPKTPPLAQSFRQVVCNSESPEALAKLRMKAVEQPTGIFGVPLRQSITYANVAISLVDGDGKSYIYGYVPIVVAKCGVFLKEKGMCFV
jgi:hypothetical protein